MLIRSISFILENCEVITIDGKYIGDICIEDIQQEISRLACNHIGYHEICKSFFVEIHKDADKPYYPLGINEYETTTFRRLREYNDITQIDVTLYDPDNKNIPDITKHYFVSWQDNEFNESENINQSSYISQHGWMYISIEKDVKIEDIIETKDVNDDNYSDFVASMYNIGDKYCKI